MTDLITPGSTLGRRVTDRRAFLVSLLLLAIAWETAGRVTEFLFLPPLSDVFSALAVIIADGTIGRELIQSLLALGGGIAIAIVLGVVVGTMMGIFPHVRYALDIYIDALMSAPMVAFIPLFIIVFGLGYTTRVSVVVLFAFFPIVINTFTGIHRPDQDVIQMSRSFGASRSQMFLQVRLPMAYPQIRAGIRLGMARGVDGLITGEVLIAAVGLGGLVMRFGNAFTMDRLWAVIFVIVVLTMLAIAATDALGRAVLGRRPTT